jgi:chromate transporter
MPGPLFSFAAYLGASVRPAQSPAVLWSAWTDRHLSSWAGSHGGSSSILERVAWQRLIQAALTGVNASVVGILIAALFQSLWTTTIHSSFDFWIALSAFALLTLGKVQPWIVVAGVAALSMLIS